MALAATRTIYTRYQSRLLKPLTLRAPHARASPTLHRNYKQASQPEGNLDVLRWCALDLLPLRVLSFFHRRRMLDSTAAADRPHTCVRLAGSLKARAQFSLRVSTRPRSASSSRRTPRWKRGHRRTTTRAYWSRLARCASRPARYWSAPRSRTSR